MTKTIKYTTRSVPVQGDDLLTLIKKQSIVMGAPLDELGRLCDWIINYEDPEDPDSLCNIRSY